MTLHVADLELLDAVAGYVAAVHRGDELEAAWLVDQVERLAAGAVGASTSATDAV